MEKEWMRRQLPEQPPKELISWTLKNFPEELGPDYLVFHAERVPIMPQIEEIMEYNDTRPRRFEWAAYCTCASCGESFYTQKVAGYDAVRLAVGEDGIPYTLEPGEPYGPGVWGEEPHIEEAFAGERLTCPLCLHEVELIHSKKLRGGRTKRLMVQTIQNVEGYTTVFYWMVVRRLDEFGMDYVDAEPMDAYVLTENGGLTRYWHARRSSFGSYTPFLEWRLASNNDDKHDCIYNDWNSINNKKSGAVNYDVYPELGGTTGEKTGLAEYLDNGGISAVCYLKFWRRHRNIENLVKSGQAKLVNSIFRRANSFCYSIEAEMAKYINFKEKKPYRMLGISRSEFRELRTRGIELDAGTLDNFKRYQSVGGKLSLIGYLDVAPDFGGGMNAAIEIMRQSLGTDLDKIARYMAKQRMHMHEVQFLVDVRQMAQRAFGERILTDEELWPRNLAASHDRLDRILAEQRRMRDLKKQEAYNEKFALVIEKYGCLQWTDGELCIILPKTSYDLHAEGETLRHCVGGYSDRHISGSDTIFFVRKHRRPERSYYTLDIRMNEEKPEEVQLHGYGNECHGVHKEHKHGIPKKVRDFVDRWEREVLLPWWIEQNKALQKEVTA